MIQSYSLPIFFSQKLLPVCSSIIVNAVKIIVKIVHALAIAIFTGMKYLYTCFYRYFFSKKKIKLNQQMSPTKKIALSNYAQGGRNACTKIGFRTLFTEINSIENLDNPKDLNSVVGLMLNNSRLPKVNLRHPKCAQVILDVFRECTDETGTQLSLWLRNENTFHVKLLKECLNVLIEKHQIQPISFFAIETFIQIYQQKRWNQVKDERHNLLLSVNHQTLVSAMTLLIQHSPNEDRIMKLVEWIMDQPEYDLKTCSTWIKVFQQKERDNLGKIIHFPLLDKIVAHLEKKQASKEWSNVDVNIKAYLSSRKEAKEVIIIETY